MMKAELPHRLRHRVSQKGTARGSRIAGVALSAILAASIAGLVPTDVHAAQVLELPQTAPASSEVPAPPPISPPARARGARSEAAPAGVGSVSDYESQEGDPQASVAAPQASSPFDRRGNRAALTNELMMGALVIGVLAMELHAAHQHR
jgi:hypothetical protein